MKILVDAINQVLADHRRGVAAHQIGERVGLPVSTVRRIIAAPPSECRRRIREALEVPETAAGPWRCSCGATIEAAPCVECRALGRAATVEPRTIRRRELVDAGGIREVSSTALFG